MFSGAHFLLYSKEPEADRAFFRDVLGFRFVDVGHGWLIFALPPSELAVHPGDGTFAQMHADQPMLGSVLYLMCDDLQAVMKRLEGSKISCTPAVEADWGTATSVRLPSGGYIGLYQPKHQTAVGAARQ